MYPFHALLQSTSNQHRQCRCQAFTGRIKVAEGVGFEPTVGCPTLDFESSALNRTQPPFPKAGGNVQRPPKVEHPTSNAKFILGLAGGRSDSLFASVM